jgi:carbon monoxide dehydrogenase subunit G
MPRVLIGPRQSLFGWPVTIETSTVVPVAPVKVWGPLTDWERLGEWMLEASDFEVISEQREGVGVEAEATVRIAGIKTRDRVRVVGWEPNKRLAIEHLGFVTGTGELHLTPIGSARTHVFWAESLQAPRLGALGSLGLMALRPLMRRIFARDLRALARLVTTP